MHRLLITGGTGYLGQALIHLAHRCGYMVVATYYSRSPPLEAHPDVSWLPLDVCDPFAVEEGIDLVQPHSIIHTVYRQHEPGLWNTTAQGAGIVAQVAQQAGARLIHLSSDVLFDGEQERPYTEEDAPTPITAYGRAKADAEHLVQKACPGAVLVRTSLIYGFHPIDRHTLFMLDIARGNQTAVLFRDEYRCPIFVDDLAAALLELLHLPYQGVIHIAGSERLSRYEFGVLLAQAYGKNPERIPHGLSSESPVQRPRNCTLDIRRAQGLLRTPLRGVHAVLAAQRPVLTPPDNESQAV